jgi:MFS family permease
MTEATAKGELSTPIRPVYSNTYRGSVLAILVMVYTSNFIDRTIIGTLGQAIKVDLNIADWQLGVLGGLAFALLYTALGIPIARLAEKNSRVNIITICLVIWSGFTALCGTATNFLQLLLFRVGVGIGEAGCSPPAHSLISDYYPPKQRASALAVYSFGIPLGTMIGAVAGGWLVQHMGWRIAFFIVGAPGLIIALIVKLVIKEPPRGHSEEAGGVAEATMQGQAPSLIAVTKRLFRSASFRHMTAGVTLASFASYGSGFFAQPYFIRNFDLSYTQVGLIYGLIGGISSGAGTLIGGFLTDWVGKRDGKWYALVPAIGLAIAMPLYLAVYSNPSWTIAAALMILPGVFHYTYLGPTFGVMHNLVEPRMRATATAVLFFVLNLIALGFGPPFTGFVIDLFTQHLFAAQGLGDFLALCPGGKAAVGASLEIGAACKSASAMGTRYGMLVTILIYGWAALHYLLGSRTLAADLKRAAAGE